MEVKVIGSSSSGNCTALDFGNSVVLLDAGLHIRRVRESLGFRLASMVECCLVSHGHGDHIQHVESLIRAGIDCYMLQETAEARKVSGHRVHVIEPMEPFKAGSRTVLAFELVHDVPNAGFLVGDGDGNLAAYLTDTMYVPVRFGGVTHLLTECNWSEETLSPELDPAAKRRLMKSHMSLDVVKGMIRANNWPKLREIHLLHVSRRNGDPEYFKSEIQRLTGKPVYVAGA